MKESSRGAWMDDRTSVLKPGINYQVADGAEPHCSCMKLGATIANETQAFGGQK